LSSTDESPKKYRISFVVVGHLDNKKSTVNKPTLSAEQNIPVLDADKNKVKILILIDKFKSKIVWSIENKCRRRNRKLKR
jgi:hypothetical protein